VRVPSPNEVRLLVEAKDHDLVWSDAECDQADELVRIGWLAHHTEDWEDDDFTYTDDIYSITADGEIVLRAARHLVR
jgi:hypothetical protein